MDPLKRVEYLIVHHSEREYDFPFFIKIRHKVLRGWEDSGYHFLIGNGKLLTEEGKIYQGRPEEMQGAHARGYNHNSLGICVIGNSDREIPPEAQFQALCSLLERKMHQYSVPLENIRGHKELPHTDTSCPGRYLNMTYVRAMLWQQRSNGEWSQEATAN